MNTKHHENLLYKELSYQIQGAAIEVRKNFGPGHKETLYQNAFVEELKSRGIKFEKEKSIKIYSPKTKKFIGLYKPDFIIEDKIIVEIKASEKIPKLFINQIYDYLRNSRYELGYFINFASPKLYVKRIILTNDRKPFLKKFLVAISLIFVLLSVSSEAAQAAKLYFEPQELVVGTKGDFVVAVNLDAENPINAINVALSISQSIIPVDTNDGNSIINLWLDKPNWDESSRLLSFSGIIPGGFSGQGARLLLIKFKTQKDEGLATLVFNQAETKAFLNTPDGIQDTLQLEPLSLPIVKGKENLPLEVPDKDPPEEFTPQISRDPEIFNNQWFLVFATQDKGSGLLRYEVAEQRAKLTQKETPNYVKMNWIIAESPYLLKDQNLKSYIYVKAQDKAGNERMVVLPPRYPLTWYENYLFWIIIILGIILGFVIACSMIRRNKFRTKTGNENLYSKT